MLQDIDSFIKAFSVKVHYEDSTPEDVRKDLLTVRFPVNLNSMFSTRKLEVGAEVALIDLCMR